MTDRTRVRDETEQMPQEGCIMPGKRRGENGTNQCKKRGRDNNWAGSTVTSS
jgi:hypothetical protein